MKKYITIRQGATRTCVLIGKYCLKFPSFLGWRYFLSGLLSNMQEVRFEKHLDTKLLCPIKFSVWGGFLVIMERANVDLDSDNLKEWIKSVDDGGENYSFLKNIVELKHDSIGKLENGQIVAVDYG